MKPETEKRMAERVKCYIRGGKLYLPDDNYFCQASPFEIALWQLCGELMEAQDEVLDILWRDIDDLRDPKLSLVQVAAKAANAIYWRRQADARNAAARGDEHGAD